MRWASKKGFGESLLGVILVACLTCAGSNAASNSGERRKEPIELTMVKKKQNESPSSNAENSKRPPARKNGDNRARP